MSYNEEEFIEFSELNTGIFKNPDDYDIEGEEAWKRGILFADDTQIFTQVEIARSYKRAADALVSKVQDSNEPFNLAYPIFYMYRHALELYLKILSGHNHETDIEGHYLSKLIGTNEAKYQERFPIWMRDRLYDFHSIDPGSTAFRYIEGPCHPALRPTLWVVKIRLAQVVNFRLSFLRIRKKALNLRIEGFLRLKKGDLLEMRKCIYSLFFRGAVKHYWFTSYLIPRVGRYWNFFHAAPGKNPILQ